MKTFIHLLGATALCASAATTALSDGGTFRSGHDNKTDPFENPAHACTAVFSKIVEAGMNGNVTVEVFGSNQLGTAASTSSRCGTGSSRPPCHPPVHSPGTTRASTC